MDNPIKNNSRAQILDVLRGIALLGVFVANIAVFSGYVFMSEKQKTLLPTATTDVIIDFFHYAFVDGKFYSMFSLLFGIGFSIIISKVKGRLTFYKRLLVLIAIGLAHSFLLWYGDILLLYALLGLLLPLFSKVSNKTLIIVATVLILSPIALDTARTLSDDKFSPENYFYQKGAEKDKEIGLADNTDFLKLVSEADYFQFKNILVGGFYYRWGGLIESNRLPKVFALFLLGMMIGRNRWYENLAAKKPQLLRIRKWSIMIGLPVTFAFAYLSVFNQEEPKIAHAVAYAFSVIPMAFVYITSLVLWYIKNPSRLTAFAFVGKMTLTNYILQSCSAFLLFYGTGMGWFGKIGSTVTLFIAVGVFGIQIVLSKFWLRYFEFGPLEWIWRQLTYGKLIPLRKSN